MKRISTLFVVSIVVILYGLFLQFSEGEDSKTQEISPTQKIEENVQGVTTTQVSPTSQQTPRTNSNVQKTVYVTEVFDGDTIQTDSGERIRLLGINAPETGQPYSAQSAQSLKEMALNHTVGLEMDVQSIDRYGRTLAYVYVGDTFINEQQLLRGVAVVQTIQPNVKYQELFVTAQEQSRKDCKGMWEGICKSDLNNASLNVACIKIVSVNANPPGDDNTNKNGEYIEIKNECPSSVEMEKWLLKDSSASNKFIFPQFTLSSNQSVKIRSGCGLNTATDLYWKCPEGRYAIWNNSGDNAYLYNNVGNLIVDYKY